MSDDKMYVSRNFKTGMKQIYDIEVDELATNWKYCGGNKGGNLSYFRMSNPKTELPKHIKVCPCGAKIDENCYITNGVDIIPVGKCCIRFILAYQGRICDKCGSRHRNRRDNICNACRNKFFIRYFPKGEEVTLSFK